MKQLTLQEQYNLIKEGKGHKDVFLKTAKSQFPNIVPNAATFEQASSLLKQRSVISENIWGVATGKNTQPDWFSIFNENVNENYVASSQEEPVKNNDKKISKEVEEDLDHNFDYKDPKNRDNVYGQDFLIGYYAEMKDPKNSEKTMDELLELVSKNLAKDRLYYVKDGQFGVKGLGYTEDAPGLGAGKEAKGKYKSSGYGDLKENKKLRLKEIGMFNDPIGYKKSEPNPKDEIFTKKFVGISDTPGHTGYIYDIYKNGVKVKTIEGEGNANAWINNEKRKLEESKNSIYEGLGDGPLDKLFYKEYPKNKNEILKFLAKHKKGLSADEKQYYVKRYMKIIKDDNVDEIHENKNDMIKLTDLLEGKGEYYMPETKTPKKKEEPKKKVKKSPISDRVKEIEEESMLNAMESKIQAMAEEIEMRENKLAMIDENEDLQEFINPVRIKEMQREIAELERTKDKMVKEYEKKSKGRKPKEVIDETETEEEY